MLVALDRRTARCVYKSGKPASRRKRNKEERGEEIETREANGERTKMDEGKRKKNKRRGERERKRERERESLELRSTMLRPRPASLPIDRLYLRVDNVLVDNGSEPSRMVKLLKLPWEQMHAKVFVFLPVHPFCPFLYLQHDMHTYRAADESICANILNILRNIRVVRNILKFLNQNFLETQSSWFYRNESESVQTTKYSYIFHIFHKDRRYIVY